MAKVTCLKVKKINKVFGRKLPRVKGEKTYKVNKHGGAKFLWENWSAKHF